MLPDVWNVAKPLEVEYRWPIHQNSDQSNSGRKEIVKPPCAEETEGQGLVVALICSLYEKKLLPMDDPVISQLQKSFSKACGNVVFCITSYAAFVTLKRRQLLLSHVVPSVSDAQKRNLLSDPFFQTSSLFSASSVDAARSAARDLSLFKPHLKASSSTTQSRRPPYSSSSAQRGPARQSSRQSSSQRSSSPFRQQSGKKGDSRFQ